MTLDKILNKKINKTGKNKYKYTSKQNFIVDKKPSKVSKINFKSILSVFSLATVVLICATIFICIAVSLIFLYRYVTTSDYFALKNIDVAGDNNLSYSEVIDRAEVHVGLNSLAVSIDEIEQRLLKDPWIKDVSVKRSLPDGLEISITERAPRFWSLHNGTMYYTEEDGQRIAPVEASHFVSLPVLEIAKDSEYFAPQLAVVLQSLERGAGDLPKDFLKPALLRLSQARGLEIFIEKSKLRLSLGLDDVEGNAKRTAKVLRDLEQRGELEIAREIRAHGGKVWVIEKE